MQKNTSNRRRRSSNGFGSASGNQTRSSRFSRGGSSGSFSGRRRSGRSSKPRNAETARGIEHFIRQASNAPKPKTYTIQHAFADFGFSEQIASNLAQLGYVTPTPIQDQSIPAALSGRDIVGMANTGTGKTGAFLLPLIERLVRREISSVLIIAPTRELAMQIDTEFKSFSRGMRLFSTVCIGGAPIFKQIQNLRRTSHVVIGTPGRLEDLAKRGVLDFGVFDAVVLDEVDRMFDMGFVQSIKKILSKTKPKRQTLFFSATMPTSIQSLVAQFVDNPLTVEIRTGTTTHTVRQDVVRVQHRSEKINTLTALLTQPDFTKVLIFSETKREVEQLATHLHGLGFKADSIHGDKRQHQRQRSLDAFRANRTTILVATDVAARGLDIKEVSHVINYTVPQTYDDYVHRIGRTGRGSETGVALTFV